MRGSHTHRQDPCAVILRLSSSESIPIFLDGSQWGKASLLVSWHKERPQSFGSGLALSQRRYQPRIASLQALATRNLTTRLALILIVSPVAGLVRPVSRGGFPVTFPLRFIDRLLTPTPYGICDHINGARGGAPKVLGKNSQSTTPWPVRRCPFWPRGVTFSGKRGRIGTS
jgi:hypothetical protein